jgi:hypothetical protein
MRGKREEAWQEVICNRCGSGKFILPVNVYPPVLPPEEVVDSAPSAPPPPPELPVAKVATEKVEGIAVDVKHSKRFFTPKRLFALLGVIGIAIAGATIYWSVQQAKVQAAESDFKEHADAGLAFVRAGKFSEAVHELEQAVAALDVLDRDDEKALEVRQMLKESEAASNLSRLLLFEMLEGFEAHVSRGSSDWETEFQSEFAKQWVVLETQVYRDSTGSIVLDFPLFIGSAMVRLKGDLSIFEKMTITKEPRTFILALQLESCERFEKPSPYWVIQFKPQSAFLWMNYENLLAIGFGPAAEEGKEVPGKKNIRQRLADQAKIVRPTE